MKYKTRLRRLMKSKVGIIIAILVLIVAVYINWTMPWSSSKISSTTNLNGTSSTSGEITSNVNTNLTDVDIKNLTLEISPKSVIQGEPVMITIYDTDVNTSSINPNAILNYIKSAVEITGTNTTSLHFSIYNNKVISLYGTDIKEKTGTAIVKITLKNGKLLSASFDINPRITQIESMPVPEQLGGNSTANQLAVDQNLAKENSLINSVLSNATTAFWKNAFTLPLKTQPIITDTYGYSRDSGAVQIAHKGTDFRASVGTPVYAINNGIVRLTKNLTIYGGTVIIDHGLSIESLYMHMSKFNVSTGQIVHTGDLIGYSGSSGYATGPHLHLSIKIHNISIDPVKFYALFGVKI